MIIEMMNHNLLLELVSHAPTKDVATNLCLAYPEFTPKPMDDQWKRLLRERFGPSAVPNYQQEYTQLFHHMVGAYCFLEYSKLYLDYDFQFQELSPRGQRVITELSSSILRSPIHFFHDHDPDDRTNIEDYKSRAQKVITEVSQLIIRDPIRLRMYPNGPVLCVNDPVIGGRLTLVEALRLLMSLPLKTWETKVSLLPPLDLSEIQWRELIQKQFPNFPQLTYQEIYLNLL